MGKNRKPGSSWHERLPGSFDDYNGSSIQTGSTGGLELREEDVWAAADDRVDRTDPASYGAPATDWDSVNPSRSIIRSRRWVHGERRHVGGLSLAFKDGVSSTQSSRILRQYHGQDNVESPHGRHEAASPPVNVPDWSMINRVNSVESLHESEEDEDESERIPPHQYLAREYERRYKVGATSVLEGVGRTLKGRDMSRVREAVWSQTGFDG